MNAAITEIDLSSRKQRILEYAERFAAERDTWIEKNSSYYEDDRKYMRFLVKEGSRVLELGCGTGQLLGALRPEHGVGIDFSAAMIDIARQKYPDLEFRVGDIEKPATFDDLDGPFDYIVMSDAIGALDDCEETLRSLHRLCTQDTRVIISYYSMLWEPILRLGETLGLKMPQTKLNWLSSEDIGDLLYLADYEIIKKEWRQLLPKRLLGLGALINRYVAPLPLIRRLSLRNYVVARPLRGLGYTGLSTSIVIPCRNERGNLENAISRTPSFCTDIEFLFVEGGSHDGSYEEAQRIANAYPQHDIKVVKQDGKGKGDAVCKGFAIARGDLLMILDADLTTPPESLDKFYRAISKGKGNFVMGSRLVYPLEDEAMRILNHWANSVFAKVFSWLLNERITDTLCGTKVILKKDYEAIAEGRSYFGYLDPFGDFDLIFGAAKLNFKIVEIPVRYAAREYGETQISRFRHGWLLLRMVALAFRKLKAF